MPPPLPRRPRQRGTIPLQVPSVDSCRGGVRPAVAHTLLKLGNATLHRGLIDAESLGSCLHAARARERQEMPEIVP